MTRQTTSRTRKLYAPSGSVRGKARRRARRGRPPIHFEPWTKATVVLLDRQIRFLDRLAGTIRRRTGAPISRAQLIRGFVEAVADAGIDFRSARSEADVRAALLARLARIG